MVQWVEDLVLPRLWFTQWPKKKKCNISCYFAPYGMPMSQPSLAWHPIFALNTSLHH